MVKTEAVSEVLYINSTVTQLIVQEDLMVLKMMWVHNGNRWNEVHKKLYCGFIYSIFSLHHILPCCNMGEKCDNLYNMACLH
jgi:hypothetical protein